MELLRVTVPWGYLVSQCWGYSGSPDARVEAREKAGARDSGAGSGARRGKLSSSEEEWWSRR